MDKVAFFRIQCPLNRKNREIFKTFEKKFSTTSGCRARYSKPLLLQNTADSIVCYEVIQCNIAENARMRWHKSKAEWKHRN